MRTLGRTGESDAMSSARLAILPRPPYFRDQPCF